MLFLSTYFLRILHVVFQVIPSEHPVYLLHLIYVAAGKDVIL